MQIRCAHRRTQGIDFIVFGADARIDSDTERSKLLSQLVVAARTHGLHVEKAALAFRKGGRTRFYGAPDLVRFLARNGMPGWTHTLTV